MAAADPAASRTSMDADVEEGTERAGTICEGAANEGPRVGIDEIQLEWIAVSVPLLKIYDAA